MNIKISDFWLRDFLDTKATPKQIGKYLSLCSQSVEKIIPEEGDFIYDIEITTNRPDCLSVSGIARELAAILPRFNIKANLKQVPWEKISPRKNGLPLQIKISKNDLCPRFTALIYDNITIKPSPDFVQKRLKASGIRSLNNVIDISNYLMVELGQPMHTFDYDKILKNKMFLREAQEGEEIITLDGQKRKLPAGAIVIEDGEGRLVDLCGIMGAKNSETDEQTKRVLLFVQTYNPARIRKTCQTLGFRTEAAARFEKGVDPEGVIPAMERATFLFREWCGGKVASELIDIYPSPPKPKTVSLDKKRMDTLLGIDLDLEEAKNYLEALGFKTKRDSAKNSLTVLVPHWRNNDIDIPEDLVEEIARLYGYHNLPNLLPPISQVNFQNENNFKWEEKIKIALKYWGFTETASYSMVGENLILDNKNHLKIANPLTNDLLYLRTSLLPSLLEILKKNPDQGEIKLFEMANVYLPRGNEELPEEVMTLSLVIPGKNKYLQAKGFLEALLKELGINEFSLRKSQDNFWQILAEILVKGTTVGKLGQISLAIQNKFNLEDNIFALELNLQKLLVYATGAKKYSPLPKYPPVIEDLSFIFPPQTFIGPVIEEIKKISVLIKNVKLVNTYQDTQTFRITYQSNETTLNDNKVKQVRKEVIKKIESKFAAKLKASS